MQSKVSNASHCRLPSAARCSVLRSLIPSRLPLGPRTKRWPKPPRAVEKSESSSGEIVTDEVVPREVTTTSQLEHQGSQVSNDKKAVGLDPDLKVGWAGLDLKVHELRSGVIQSVEAFGVYVDIGAGSIGLLHQKQISHKRLNPEEIAKMFSVGDKIKVMVHRIDNDRQRINLSTRSLEVSRGDMVKNPQLVYEKAEEAAAAFRAKLEGFLSLKVHELRSGVVQSVQKYGFFVDVGAGSPGLLHVSNISSPRVTQEEFENMFSVGDAIKVMVLQIDNGRRRFSLSTKSLEVNPGDMVKDPQLVYEKAEEAAAAFRAKLAASEQEKEKAREVYFRLKIHDLRSGVVQSVENYGVLVDIGAGCIGLLQNKEISSDFIGKEDIKKMFRAGDEIKVMVHQLDNDRQRINLSTKSLEVIPGDMAKDPQLVYEKAEEAAAAFRANVAASEQ